MNNFIQPGCVLTLTAPVGGVTSGTPVKIGSLVVIPAADAAADAAFEGQREGVFEVDKVAAQAWAEGDKIYWDNAAALFTTVAGGNTLVGVAVETAANPTSTGKVYLDGVVRA
jgi:predicted RecA/RadA family phage recombinase